MRESMRYEGILMLPLKKNMLPPLKFFGKMLPKRRGLRARASLFGSFCRYIEKVSKMLSMRGSSENHLLLLSLK